MYSHYELTISFIVHSFIIRIFVYPFGKGIYFLTMISWNFKANIQNNIHCRDRFGIKSQLGFHATLSDSFSLSTSLNMHMQFFMQNNEKSPEVNVQSKHNKALGNCNVFHFIIHVRHSVQLVVKSALSKVLVNEMKPCPESSSVSWISPGVMCHVGGNIHFQIHASWIILGYKRHVSSAHGCLNVCRTGSLIPVVPEWFLSTSFRFTMHQNVEGCEVSLKECSGSTQGTTIQDCNI